MKPAKNNTATHTLTLRLRLRRMPEYGLPQAELGMSISVTKVRVQSAYLQLRQGRSRQVHESMTFDRSQVILDLDKKGEPVGLEVLEFTEHGRASTCFPEFVAWARKQPRRNLLMPMIFTLVARESELAAGLRAIATLMNDERQQAQKMTKHSSQVRTASEAAMGDDPSWYGAVAASSCSEPDLAML